MSDQHLILENSFWKFLVSVEDLKDKKDIVLLCLSLGIDEIEMESYCTFLNRFNVFVSKDAQYIYPFKEQCKIKIEFSLAEWLALQASMPKDNHKDSHTYYHQIMQNKIQMAQMAYARFSIYKKPDEVVVEATAFEMLKKKIDFVIMQRQPIKIKFFADKECAIFPHRLVFLDGTLCVVGENLHDKTLVYFGVEDILTVDDFAFSYDPNLSQIEVSEFICHLRLINGKEERLVLKIYSQDEADLLPAHHFLGNPFVTSSVEGDMIWAATIEMCDDIFNWLYKMKDRVEVLDPVHIRKEFAHFCEFKKENSSDKKAS